MTNLINKISNAYNSIRDLIVLGIIVPLIIGGSILATSESNNLTSSLKENTIYEFKGYQTNLLKGTSMERDTLLTFEESIRDLPVSSASVKRKAYGAPNELGLKIREKYRLTIEKDRFGTRITSATPIDSTNSD